jgi:hypothetical protein
VRQPWVVVRRRSCDSLPFTRSLAWTCKIDRSSSFSSFAPPNSAQSLQLRSRGSSGNRTDINETSGVEIVSKSSRKQPDTFFIKTRFSRCRPHSFGVSSAPSSSKQGCTVSASKRNAAEAVLTAERPGKGTEREKKRTSSTSFEEPLSTIPSCCALDGSTLVGE